ncbi:MAG: CDP-alcohol phosphatidyltransferase family protein [Vicinamibacterales bacterium]
MPAAERNRRLARRYGGVDRDAADGRLPRLVVPPDAALTPALFHQLASLAPDRVCRLVWHETHPPLWWRPAHTGEDDGAMQSRVLDPSLVLDISSPSARRAATWQLLRASGKPQDGWLSRHLHRRISRVFSYGFIQLGLSANVATLFAFAVGLAAAALMAQTSHATMVAGAFLFWFASIADGIDGEVARLTLTESRFGEQLDTGVDQLTHLSGLLGVLVGWWRQGIGPEGIALGAGVLIGTPVMLLWAMALVRQARQTDQFFVPTKPIELAIFKAADASGAWALRATGGVFLLFRREAFSFAFFMMSLVTARRAAIPAAIACGLAIVLVTFLGHGRTLRRALREIAGQLPAGAPTSRTTRGSVVPS